MKLNTSDSS